MAFSPDGKRIAATGCEKLLRLFDSATGVVTLSLARPDCGANPAFTRDGRLLGWTEPAGYRFIDLGKQAEDKEQKAGEK
jgi:WD40 repeat protein